MGEYDTGKHIMESIDRIDGNNNVSELIQRTVMQYDCAGDLFDCYRLGVCDIMKG